MIPAGPKMVSCERVVELLLEYLEGGLSPEAHAAMKQHLERCPPCVAFARQYEKTSKVCRDELRRDMPEAMREHLLEFLRDRTDERG